VADTRLGWLTARPIAHRGLHDAAAGIIENTAGAMRAAMDANFGIEVDLQISANGEAMVNHDDVLGRLTEGDGRLDQLTAAELQRVPFRGSSERMLTLGDLCDLVGGRVPIVPELKSRFDGDARLPLRAAAILSRYQGPVAPMSFDPVQLHLLRQKAPGLPRGIVAAKYRPHPYWDQMPHFVAYAFDNLPALAPWLARHILCLPLLTWVVRTPHEQDRAGRWTDQIIFEGFRP
jgi:glycerophosphoryl diester phosphodiesterase